MERRARSRSSCTRAGPRHSRCGGQLVELFVFVAASIMVLAGAIGVVTRSNPVHAALSMVLTLFGVAVMFVSLEAHFLAAVQVIVYAGAIVVLFLFVIMLLGVDKAEDVRTEPLKVQRPLALIVATGVAGVLVAAMFAGRDTIASGRASIDLPTVEDSDANTRQLARLIFSDYVVAFEVTSVLLVIAVVGTVLLARKRRGEKSEVSV
ncbi:MAG: NADH-quinone oxidoreductase subunit J [Actinobacteria bacterium]|nr:NADH-quinone oxidoreductase subunit J [Actinomycetota bacterium]